MKKINKFLLLSITLYILCFSSAHSALTFKNILEQYISKKSLNKAVITTLLSAKSDSLNDIALLLDTKESAALITTGDIENLLLKSSNDEKNDYEMATFLFSHSKSKELITILLRKDKNFIKKLFFSAMNLNKKKLAFFYLVDNSYTQSFLDLADILDVIEKKDKKQRLNPTEESVAIAIRLILIEEQNTGCIIS